jgi:hypothetical protein
LITGSFFAVSTTGGAAVGCVQPFITSIIPAQSVPVQTDFWIARIGPPTNRRLRRSVAKNRTQIENGTVKYEARTASVQAALAGTVRVCETISVTQNCSIDRIASGRPGRAVLRTTAARTQPD